jgi:sulfur carrier protein
MRLTINGDLRELAGVGACSLDELLVHLALPLDRVAVEHNGAVIRRSERALRTINDGDVLEIVTLVGGG